MAILYPITIDNIHYAASMIDDSIYVVPVNQDGFFMVQYQAWIMQGSENYDGIASTLKEVEISADDMGVEVVFENLYIDSGLYVNYVVFLSDSEVFQRDPLAIVWQSKDEFFQVVPFSENLRFISFLESFLHDEMVENAEHILFDDAAVRVSDGDFFVFSGNLNIHLGKVSARYILKKLQLEMI